MPDKNAAAAKNGAQPAASGLPLFYQSPMPLDSTRHGKLGLKANFGLSFTSKVNAVPINMIEMPQLSHVYPIAFSPDDSATPVAILGLRDNENLFVDAKGEWQADTYIPAYIRRYPFIFSETPGNDQLMLCIDNDEGIVSDSSEQKFFDAEGKPTLLSQNALEFCKSYHAAAQQTAQFSEALSKSGLLVTRQAELNVADGQRIQFSGFRVVDEQKLADFSDKDFLEWRQRGWLPFLYAHLFSGAQWARLSVLLRAKMANGPTAVKKK